jgi:hypothetical protein
MFNSPLKYGIFFFIVFFIIGCEKKENKNNQIAAQVGENKLYLSEVLSVIPPDVEPKDSTLMTEDYINKWLKRELLLQKAEENLSSEEKNVTKQLEEYRKSLIIYKYKNALISQRMDTTVTEEQIQEYYNLNSGKFILNKNIVKAIFIKIPRESAKPDQLKEMCNNTTTEGVIELRDYCLQYAKVFNIFTEQWADFQHLIKNMPQPLENPDQFLQQNEIIEQRDSDYYYLVNVQDYKLKNKQAPMNYVKKDIKNLILNRRKIEFLKQLEKNIYSEGIKKNKFKIFKTEMNDAE